MLVIDAIISCLHFFYGYHSALEYVPHVLSAAANESTRTGRLFSAVLLILTSVPCAAVLLWSTLTIITLRSTFRVPRTLSNGAIQRDPVTGATRVSYLNKQRASSGDTQESATINTIASNLSHKPSNAGEQQSLNLRKTRQYSRLNFLTILFGIRFSLVWFGSLLVSSLVVSLKTDMTTLYNNSTYLSVNGTLVNDTLPLILDITPSPLFNGSTFARKTWLAKINKVKNIRLSIVFYCVCLLGIEDMCFYIACNKRFRKANVHFIRRIRKFCSILKSLF